MAVDQGVQVKSKREIEKELWPFVRPNVDFSTNEGFNNYQRFQREFQKKLSEQLKHNPITVSDLLLRVDIMAVDIEKLLQMDMSLRKKPQKQ